MKRIMIILSVVLLAGCEPPADPGRFTLSGRSYEYSSLGYYYSLDLSSETAGALPDTWDGSAFYLSDNRGQVEAADPLFPVDPEILNETAAYTLSYNSTDKVWEALIQFASGDVLYTVEDAGRTLRSGEIVFTQSN